MIKHINIKIFGRVQGVGFRYFVKQRANKAGLKGFVQNQQDGAAANSAIFWTKPGEDQEHQ